ncbi:methyltransferase domain-containing protein [Pedobacter sp. UBA4863]|uniref:methyltransferase domain-containing protein n=1 Tax=Pedobacter sp. UBA4863 TaxID=1947060 RepID=UPI0025DBF4FD|nr:methyltransferase domain-containing protein [Pedobacter sp. UBA4863]
MKKEQQNSADCALQNEVLLDQNYWDQRWQSRQTAWDIGMAAPAITQYMQQYPNKNAAILIPGCGNAYEAEWLLKNGFTNITLIDIAPKAVEVLKAKFAGHPEVKVLLADFFEHQGQYDLMIEQTFFCAIAPAKRKAYAKKASTLLKAKGKIIGLLFNKDFNQPHPPFGGNISEYSAVFEPYFSLKTMHPCTNSITPRAGTEVFINLIKIKRDEQLF